MAGAAAPVGDRLQPAIQSTGTISKSSLRYMPGLDVLRGLAILMVLVYHGSSPHKLAIFSLGKQHAEWLLRAFSIGAMGVELFFILSGFLITGILLDSRLDQDYFRNFYLRRVLRIVPAYLLMLLVLFLTRSIDTRYLVICLLYFANMTGIFHSNPQYGPLWSLSVEEQFYLVWPLVVWRISRRHLSWISLALILGTPLLRLSLLYGPHALHDISTKTWVLMDFFAAGSCLAIAVRSPRLRLKLPRLLLPLIVTGALLVCLQLWLPTPHHKLMQNILLSITLDPWLLLLSGLVLFAYLHPGIASTSVSKPLVFLARISYGLYLYHAFLFALVDRHWPARLATSLPLLANAAAQFTVSVCLAIAIAYVSRNTIEEFFLRLKPKHTATQPARDVQLKIT